MSICLFVDERTQIFRISWTNCVVVYSCTWYNGRSVASTRVHTKFQYVMLCVFILCGITSCTARLLCYSGCCCCCIAAAYILPVMPWFTMEMILYNGNNSQNNSNIRIALYFSFCMLVACVWFWHKLTHTHTDTDWHTRHTRHVSRSTHFFSSIPVWSSYYFCAFFLLIFIISVVVAVCSPILSIFCFIPNAFFRCWWNFICYIFVRIYYH